MFDEHMFLFAPQKVGISYKEKKYDVLLRVAGIRSLPMPWPCYPLSWGQHFVPASPAALPTPSGGEALRGRSAGQPVLSLNNRKHPA